MRNQNTVMATVVISVALVTLMPDRKADGQTSSSDATQAESSAEFRFAFVGCNRVQRGDKHMFQPSTANEPVLKQIFRDILASKDKPKLLFFLGDMVLGETSHIGVLDHQLMAWVALYEKHMKSSGIELVAIPGNHEMLYYHDVNVPGHDEWPLAGATNIWIKHMLPYMPKDRDVSPSEKGFDNRLTYSFVRANVGFVVMNTDTYNSPTDKNQYGLEGMIPTDWIVARVREFQNDPKIEHVFVLGHKPYYVNKAPQTGHVGLPEGPVLWPRLKQAHVNSMLSAHYHDYQRYQPGDLGTYQIIAGNGGSSGPATFYGYTQIHINRAGVVELVSRGMDKGDPYYTLPANPVFTERDKTILSWSKNANPFPAN